MKYLLMKSKKALQKSNRDYETLLERNREEYKRTKWNNDLILLDKTSKEFTIFKVDNVHEYDRDRLFVKVRF